MQSADEVDRKVIQFLKNKIVERERTIFQLQSELVKKDEKVHDAERMLRSSQSYCIPRERFRLWRSTSQLVVASLLARSNIVEEANESYLALQRTFLLKPNVAGSRSGVDADRRLLASTLVECARYRQEADEQRIRGASLAHQLSLVYSQRRPNDNELLRAQLRDAEMKINEMQSFQQTLIREKELLALQVDQLQHPMRSGDDLVNFSTSSPVPAFRMPSNKYAIGL